MQSSKKYPWVVVALLWVVALLNYLDRQVLSTLKPSMMVDIIELQSATNFGRLMAVFLWIYGFMSPVAGLIADRVSKKKLIISSLFVWSAVTFSMGFASTFDQLYVLRAIMGVSEALYIPAGLALITEYHVTKTRSLAVGIHLTGLLMGQALGGFGALFAKTFSWQLTFQSLGISGILYAFVLIIFLKDKKAEGIRTDIISPKISGTLGVLLTNFSFLIVLLCFTIPSLPGWAVKNWLPTLFAENLGIDMTKAGPLSTITIAASSLIGVLFGGILSDRWVLRNNRGRVYTSAIGLSLTIPSMILIGYGHSLLAVVGAAFCFGFGFGAFDANNMPLVCQFVSPKYRATAYGLMNLTGISAGAYITDWLGKSSDAGKLGDSFIMLASIVVVAVMLQLIFLRPKTTDFQEA